VKDVLSLKNYSKYVIPGVRDLYFISTISRKLLHHAYDLETDFHRNSAEQKAWSSKVISMVNQLDAFAATDYDIKENKRRK
jgi:hypothetical protein